MTISAILGSGHAGFGRDHVAHLKLAHCPTISIFRMTQSSVTCSIRERIVACYDQLSQPPVAPELEIIASDLVGKLAALTTDFPIS
jgi:hypothetical protein